MYIRASKGDDAATGMYALSAWPDVLSCVFPGRLSQVQHSTACGKGDSSEAKQQGAEVLLWLPITHTSRRCLRRWVPIPCACSASLFLCTSFQVLSSGWVKSSFQILLSYAKVRCLKSIQGTALGLTLAAYFCTFHGCFSASHFYYRPVHLEFVQALRCVSVTLQMSLGGPLL